MNITLYTMKENPAFLLVKVSQQFTVNKSNCCLKGFENVHWMAARKACSHLIESSFSQCLFSNPNIFLGVKETLKWNAILSEFFGELRCRSNLLFDSTLQHSIMSLEKGL